MASTYKGALALSLEIAKQNFEKRLREVIEAYNRTLDGPLHLTLNFGSAVGQNRGDRDLVDTVRGLVDSFSGEDVVQETGVSIHSITAVDSDKKGHLALNVKYAYPK